MIPILRDRASGVRSTLMQQLLGQIGHLASPEPTAPPSPGTPEPPAPAATAPVYINASDIKVPFPRTYLANEPDVDQYVDELRKFLLAQVQQGKKVIV